MKKMKSILFMTLVFVLLLNTSNVMAQEPVLAKEEHNVIIHEPPANFNALTATDKELAYYFYPPRPKDIESLKEWEKLVDFKWVRPEFVESSDRNLESGKPEVLRYTNYSNANNWAGIVKNTSVRRVAGSWIVPTITAATANRPAYNAQWIGLGGYVSGEPLLQTGTHEDINAAGVITRKVWYEIIGMNLNDAPVYLSNIPISNGDSFSAELAFEKVSKEGVTTITISNTTQKVGTSFCPQNVTTWTSALSSAEWILERPLTSSGLTNLAKANTTFTGAKWASTATGTLANVADSTTTTSLSMIGGTSTTQAILAYPSTLSNGSFTVTWNGYN